MAGNRPTFGEQKKSAPLFWAKPFTTDTATLFAPSTTATLFPASATMSPMTKATSNDMDMSVDALADSLGKVSIVDTVRAVLTDTNTNFEDLCSQLSSLQVGEYRANTLREADLIADRVETDLAIISRLHGEAKDDAEQNRRLMIVQVVQSYVRCLELDIEKWKSKLRSINKHESEIAAIKVFIREFVPWGKRPNTTLPYMEEKIEKPMSDTEADKIGFVQLALNYWRSCYYYLRDYEKLMGLKPVEFEKKLWQLEQTTMSYLHAIFLDRNYTDINYSRMREPRNINPTTGQPLSVGAIQEMIKQQQEQAGYKPRV